jgi:hypothetical protein
VEVQIQETKKKRERRDGTAKTTTRYVLYELSLRQNKFLYEDENVL